MQKKIARIFDLIYLVAFIIVFILMWVLAIRGTDFKGWFDWILLIFLGGAVDSVYLLSRMNNVEAKKDLIFIGVVEIVFGNIVAGVMCLTADVDKWNGSVKQA